MQIIHDSETKTKKKDDKKICNVHHSAVCYIEANLAYHDMFISPPYIINIFRICLRLSMSLVVE